MQKKWVLYIRTKNNIEGEMLSYEQENRKRR